MLRYACPNCQQSLQTADQHAGSKVNCPRCGQKIRVPSLPAPPPNPKTVLAVLNEHHPDVQAKPSHHVPPPVRPPMAIPIPQASYTPSAIPLPQATYTPPAIPLPGAPRPDPQPMPLAVSYAPMPEQGEGPPTGWLQFERFCTGLMGLGLILSIAGILRGHHTEGTALFVLGVLMFFWFGALSLVVGDVARRMPSRHVFGVVLLIGIFGLVGLAVWLAVRPPLRYK